MLYIYKVTVLLLVDCGILKNYNLFIKRETGKYYGLFREVIII